MGPESGWPGLHDPCSEITAARRRGLSRRVSKEVPALGKSGRYHEVIMIPIPTLAARQRAEMLNLLIPILFR